MHPARSAVFWGIAWVLVATSLEMAGVTTVLGVDATGVCAAVGIAGAILLFWRLRTRLGG